MAAPSTSFKPFAVVIKNHYVPTYSLRLMIDSEDFTIGKLKTQIEKEHRGNPLIEDQLLVYRGKLLESKLKLSSIFQSSFILQQSPTNTDSETVHTICVHMTLRGGSSTATKIGLTANASFDGISVPANPKLSKSESDLKSNLNSEHIQQQEEKKQQPSTSSTKAPKPPQNIAPQFVHVPPPQYAPYYHPYHPPHHPLPPNPYYFSQSMPNLMHHPSYLHRTQSAPSHPFHPPTLVQQSSHPHTPQQYHPPPYIPPPHMHYAPYGAMPQAPHYPHHHPPFAPFPPHSHSMSDLNALRDQGQRTFVPPKIEEKDEKQDTENENNDNNANRMNNNRFGLRQRRVANNNNDNNDNAPGANNNDANNNEVFNNNANVNNNANAQGDRWFVRVFRALNINVLIRLGIFMWFFGPNLGTYRFTILCMVGALYYFHQVGLLQMIFGNWFARRNRNVNEARHRDPNQDEANNNHESQQEAQQPLIHLTYVQLLQRFLIGIVASLWPTWDHTALYPVPQ